MIAVNYAENEAENVFITKDHDELLLFVTKVTEHVQELYPELDLNKHH